MFASSKVMVMIMLRVPQRGSGERVTNPLSRLPLLLFRCVWFMGWVQENRGTDGWLEPGTLLWKSFREFSPERGMRLLSATAVSESSMILWVAPPPGLRWNPFFSRSALSMVNERDSLSLYEKERSTRASLLWSNPNFAFSLSFTVLQFQDGCFLNHHLGNNDCGTYWGTNG